MQTAVSFDREDRRLSEGESSRCTALAYRGYPSFQVASLSRGGGKPVIGGNRIANQYGMQRLIVSH